MSKSLKRVREVLREAGIESTVFEMEVETRTAEAAASEANCTLDQIAKSIVFVGQRSRQTVLFITAGGNQVQAERASKLASEDLTRADPNIVRSNTGFAIGGVAPIGHLLTPKAFFDPRLLDFNVVYAAAGTPRHIFSIHPKDLLRVSGAELADFVF